MSRMTDHQLRVARALEGNDGVWFHPFEDRIAIWYGHARVGVYDSRTWEEVDSKVIGVAYRQNVTKDAVECAVDVVLAELGYHRDGQMDVDELYDEQQTQLEA